MIQFNQIESLSIGATASFYGIELLLPVVALVGEPIQLSSHLLEELCACRPTTDEEWPDGLFSLLHDLLAFEFGLDLFEPLDVRIDKLTEFGRLAGVNVFRPLDSLELEEKAKDEDWMLKVDESEPNGALRLQIHRQVEVTIRAVELLIYDLKHQLLSELDWDVLDHESGLTHQVIASRHLLVVSTEPVLVGL